MLQLLVTEYFALALRVAKVDTSIRVSTEGRKDSKMADKWTRAQKREAKRYRKLGEASRKADLKASRMVGTGGRIAIGLGATAFGYETMRRRYGSNRNHY